MYNEISGPAKIERYQFKLDSNWTIVNVPKDIPLNTAKNNVHNFLTNIASLEIPTSLKCNLNCDYCYIREKWIKNIDVDLETVKILLDNGLNKILYYNREKKNQLNLCSWGAEPLCNLKTLELLVDTCINNGIKFSTSTNATIVNEKIKEIFTKIFKNGLTETIQVSLDGPAEIQNLHRKTLSGKDTFDSVISFIEMLNDIQKELNINHRLFTICGTIELNEDTPEAFIKSAKWFLDKKSPVYSRIIPIRLENSIQFNRKLSEIFVETIRQFLKFAEEYYNTTGQAVIDYYTAKLFLNTDRINGCTSCSAMRSQAAVDVDGSIYMCHGPITSPKIKPYTHFGNVLDGIIDFSSMISNIDYTISDKLYSAICKECPLISSPDITGFLCHSCPIINLLYNGNFVHYDHFRCEAYKNSLPYFRKIFEIFKKAEEKNNEKE